MSETQDESWYVTTHCYKRMEVRIISPHKRTGKSPKAEMRKKQKNFGEDR
jgi:hypothetical protein